MCARVRNPHLSILLCLASSLAIVGCGDDEAAKDKARPAEPPVVIDAAVTFDRSTFCREILPDAEVAKIAGKKMIRLPDAHTGAGVPLVQCHFTAADPDAGVTEAEEIHALVDCRSPTTGSEQRTLVEKMGSEEDDRVRSANIGGGGAVVFHQRFRARFGAIAHAELPCAIAIESRRAMDDYVDELLSLAHQRLSASNRPRPGSGVAPAGKGGGSERVAPGK